MYYATSKKLTAISQLQKREKKQWQQSYGRDNRIMRDLWNEKNKSAVYILIKLLCK